MFLEMHQPPALHWRLIVCGRFDFILTDGLARDTPQPLSLA
jgi:hypothetical protein